MRNIWVGEAKSQKEHLFADQMARQHLEETSASAPVEFIIVFGYHHFVWMVHRSMHLIEDRMCPRLVDAQVIVSRFHIKQLAFMRPSHLCQRIVICGPNMPHRQSGDYVKRLRSITPRWKVVDYQLR